MPVQYTPYLGLQLLTLDHVQALRGVDPTLAVVIGILNSWILAVDAILAAQATETTDQGPGPPKLGP